MDVRRKVHDSLIHLLKICHIKHHRAIVILIGSDVKNQIVTIYNLLNKIRENKASICWCYNNNLDFVSNKVKRMRMQRRKRAKLSTYNEADDEFFLFQQDTKVRYCRYRDVKNLLGNTYGLLVLSDVEYLTPNILCQTVETVEGAGVIILSFKSFEQFRQIQRDVTVYKQFIRSADPQVQRMTDLPNPRFFVRFVKSLAQCSNVVCFDNNFRLVCLNSESLKSIETRYNNLTNENKQAESQLAYDEFVNKFSNNERVFAILKMCKTYDQARLVFSLSHELIKLENKLHIVTASRGRGKSAALGLQLIILFNLICAEKLRYNNDSAVLQSLHSNKSDTTITQHYDDCIFINTKLLLSCKIAIVAPSLHNVQVLFSFIEHGLIKIGKLRNIDYLIETSSLEMLNASSRIKQAELTSLIKLPDYNITIKFEEIQTIIEHNSYDIVIVDEAASFSYDDLISLRNLETPVPTVFCSTVDGYEGSGSQYLLSIIDKLKETSSTVNEYVLNEPIRYKSGDTVEKWLKNLVVLQTKCLVSTDCHVKSDDLEITLVDRDLLMSFTVESEKLLRDIVSVIHRKTYYLNPNILIQISDLPNRDLFLLRDCYGVILGVALVSLTNSSVWWGDDDNANILCQFFVNSGLERAKCGVFSIFSVVSSDKNAEYFVKKLLKVYSQRKRDELNASQGLTAVASCSNCTLELDYVTVKSPLISSSIFWKNFSVVYVDPLLNKLTKQYRCLFLHALPNTDLPDNWSDTFVIGFFCYIANYVLQKSCKISSNCFVRIVQQYTESIRRVTKDPLISSDSLKQSLPSLKMVNARFTELTDCPLNIVCAVKEACIYYLQYCYPFKKSMKDHELRSIVEFITCNIRDRSSYLPQSLFKRIISTFA